MGTIDICGRRFRGNNISIVNGRVTIDGVLQGGSVSGVVEVRVLEGEVQHLRSDASVTCGDVKGAVQAGMGVTCGAVGGNVQAGMDVKCDTVGGSVTAGMGVTMRRG